ncbi:16S rRNA (cytosine(1402)-N(4))-methyltransferase RsmH [Candidatus Uhrbacteria bacterium]|nr:16S rRNA (cytosine(1402)-N(4))-methyltransferase RsmH [Candidatus Uhrbacteria bacterium]
MDRLHAPVLLEEVRHSMQPVSGGVYVDATLGVGGHARMVLEASGPDGIVVGIERDKRNLETAQERLAEFGKRVRFVHGNYRDLGQHLERLGLLTVQGILLDLGFSSVHVDDAARGFSFQREGPLDMRYDVRDGVTAADIVNTWDEHALIQLFAREGEERYARKIARAIVEARRAGRIETTTKLADMISRAVPRKGHLHPATRVFQALRIAVNDELGALEAVLPQAQKALAFGGRLLVISFHSLEDRIVKRFLRSSDHLRVLTKKPIVASADEQKQNPRSRSAKLRVAEKQ